METVIQNIFDDMTSEFSQQLNSAIERMQARSQARRDPMVELEKSVEQHAVELDEIERSIDDLESNVKVCETDVEQLLKRCAETESKLSSQRNIVRSLMQAMRDATQDGQRHFIEPGGFPKWGTVVEPLHLPKVTDRTP